MADESTHRHDWDQRYASTDRLFSVEPDETLVELATSLPAGRALDLGAGEGRNSLWLARHGWRVIAVDVSPVALGRLAGEAGAENLDIETVVDDMEQYLARGRTFELVVLSYIHPAPEQRSRLLAAAAAAVAAGGHLFFVGHHVASFGQAGPPYRERLYDEERLVDAFPGLTLLRLELRQHQVSDTGDPLPDIVAWAARPEPS